MSPQDDQSPSQEQHLRDRVEMQTSHRTGNLEDQSLDLDARTMAILGKKQQLSVSPHDQVHAPRIMLTSHMLREILVSYR